MALSEKVIKLLTRSPGDVAREQIRKLYLRLYPYIIGDFVHLADLNTALVAVQAELAAIKAQLAAHIHPTTDAPTGPAGGATGVNPAVIATSQEALALVVPNGVPQPTGAGISIYPSRVDPDPIAIPPINPLDPTGV